VPFESLTAWRFKDPRMAVAFAMIVRFCAVALRDKYPDTIFDNDPLYEHVLARAAESAPYTRPDFFARGAIQILKKASQLEDEVALMDLALQRYADEMAGRDDPADDERSSKPGQPGSARFARRVEGALADVGPAFEAQTGLSIAQVARTDDDVSVKLVHGEEPLDLLIEPAASAAHYFRRGKVCAVSHSEATVPAAEAQIVAITTLLALLDEALASPSDPSDGGAGDRSREDKLRFLLDSVHERLGDRVAGLTVVGVSEPESGVIQVRVAVDATQYELELRARRQGRRHIFRSDHFDVAYAERTPIASRNHVKLVRALILLLDRAVAQYAPELLPPG
jgi:hypothetical protein